MIDILEELLRKIRPYELHKGNADAAFEQAMDAVIDGLSRHGVNGANTASKGDRDHETSSCTTALISDRPVPIVGEYLLNFHPVQNHDIEAFLEQNGFEIIEARNVRCHPEILLLPGYAGP